MKEKEKKLLNKYRKITYFFLRCIHKDLTDEELNFLKANILSLIDEISDLEKECDNDDVRKCKLN